MTLPHVRADRPGQAIVEMALVLPLFVILLFGIIDGGRMIYSNNALSEAARDGARWGSVQGRSATVASRNGIAAETVAKVIGVDAPTASVTCEREGTLVAACRSGDILVVRVEASVAPAAPFLEALIGAPTLSAESRMVVNQ